MIWDVGVRMGSALRRSKEQAASNRDAGWRQLILSRSPSAYARAHWHALWRGPLSQPEARELKLHWLP